MRILWRGDIPPQRPPGCSIAHAPCGSAQVAGASPTRQVALVDGYDELKSWVEFTTDDEARLRAFARIAEPHLPALSELFYARVLASPGASAVLTDAAQVERLKRTLVVWARELLSGPWDSAYRARRERIGRRHVEVRLPAHYMTTAMHTFREALCQLALRELPDPVPTCGSLVRVMDLDLALMTATYVERREVSQVQTLRDLLVSHLPVTVLLLDARGEVVAATAPESRIFGEVGAVGASWRAALPAPLVQAADLGAAMAEAHARGRTVDLPRVDAALDGVVRAFRFRVVPLEHPQARTLVHLEELTEAVHAEARLQRAETLAQLGSLSAAVAHEVRNPLAGISGAIQVISGSLPDGDPRRAVMSEVIGQVRRLDSLVGDLLAFARPAQARSEEIALHEVAAIVLAILRRDHPKARLSVIGRGAARGDANLVQQILFNLVLNGLQASGEGGTVEIHVHDGGLEVRDSGPGVAEDQVDRIFQPFTTTRTRGTGLGLAICRKLASAMNGRLDLVRTPGAPAGAARAPLHGAVFRLELPASR